MATYTKFNQFVEDLAHGVHDLETDQLVVALSNTAPTAATDATLTDITQIAYTNISTRNLTTSSSAETTGTYKLTIADITLTSSGGTTGPFQYVVIYNDTPSAPANPLIAYYDNGSAVTLADGESFTIDFDAANGLFQLS